jgi:hypothetical protein
MKKEIGQYHYVENATQNTIRNRRTGLGNIEKIGCGISSIGVSKMIPFPDKKYQPPWQVLC